MGYAAEYLTRGAFTALTMGFSLLMSICCILYHFPLYQFYTLYTFYTAYINEIISLIGMQNSALASWARSHERMRSAHAFIAG